MDSFFKGWRRKVGFFLEWLGLFAWAYYASWQLFWRPRYHEQTAWLLVLFALLANLAYQKAVDFWFPHGD